jgi:type II secretory pathway pseudopilin PulG
MTKTQNHKTSGFTVVETIIVLAVGSLILLIVLFAIPALQRSSRNNQRRQDAQSILAAVSHWELNHSGNIPQSSDNYLQDTRTKLFYYDTAAITIHTFSGSSASPATVSPATNLDKIDIYNYQKCSTTAHGGSTKVGAGYSDVAALYAIETGGGISGQCQQL